ncbi:MAG TPA: CAP domain-containing protein [Thermoanaerobaculia bacterium]|nr:CAP domain-containing protein [Thermoanaerobaculia bacterium]
MTPTFLPSRASLAGGVVALAALAFGACEERATQAGRRAVVAPGDAAAVQADQERPVDRIAAALLDAHNRARQAEGAGLPGLVWDHDLAALATAWAEELRDRRQCRLVHRSRPELQGQPVGENLFAVVHSGTTGPPGGPLARPEEVVAAWTNTRDQFDHRRNRCAPGSFCGHYTQVVWRDTRAVGCGWAACELGRGRRAAVWVCNYAPAGNWVGERPY